MPRNLAIFALVLMLLTGLVVGQIRSIGHSATPVVQLDRDAGAEVATAFYVAINRYLDDGDSTDLQSLLYPEFRNHGSTEDSDANAAGFLNYLASLRSTFPGVQFGVETVASQGDLLIVELAVDYDSPGSFVGLPVETEGGFGGYEVLRAEDSQISDRWSSRDLLPRFETLASAGFSVPAQSFPDPRIDRLTFQPNGSGEFVDRDGFILIAEADGLFYEVISYPGQTASSEESRPSAIPPEGERVELRLGESVVAPAGVRFQLGSHSLETASALMISIRQADFGRGGSEPYQVIESIGVERTFLAGGGPSDVNSNAARWVVAVGRVVLLPPGEGLPVHDSGNAELLVVTEGEIDARVHDGTLIWTQPGKSFGIVEDSHTIAAGQGALVKPGSAVEYQVTDGGPATFWIVTIRSGEVPASAQSNLNRP